MTWNWIQAGVALLIVATAALALFVLYLVWRDGYVRGWRAAREKPPACPHCGYNLSGLTHCRCPECGTEYRLDQLWRRAVLPNPRSTSDRAESSQVQGRSIP